MKSIFRNTTFWLRVGWLMLGALIIAGSRELFLRGMGTGDGEFLGHFSIKWGVGLLLYGLLAWGAMFVVVYAVFRVEEVEIDWLPRVEKLVGRMGLLRPIMAAICLALPSVVLLGNWGWRFDFPNFRAMLVVVSALAAGLCLPKKMGHWVPRALIALLMASSILLVLQRLLLLTDYPFGLSWSEGNRLWDYSLYFGRERYDVVGTFRYPSYLTPGRHGLWGLPFLLFKQLSIEHVRLWDALLWILPHMILGWVVLSRRGSGHLPLGSFSYALWVFLFLSQGPIYAPIVVSAIIFVLGYRRDWLWQSALITAIACFYAGISRWTWMFSPAIWAGLWAILDESTEQPLQRRLRRPLLLGLSGLIGAVLSQIVMDRVFSSAALEYSTSLSHPLLWYRLWSSPTNPTGIIPGLLYAAGPLLLWLSWVFLSRRVRLDWLQWSVSVAAFLGFLVAGLVVSVKIGGGSNLHNLDMFFITLVLFAGYFIAKEGVLRSVPGFAWALLIAVIFLPVWNLVRVGQHLELSAPRDAREALASIRHLTMQAAEQGEVLFIDQRQLLAFGEISDVPLVLEYEMKDMMNQAMGSNQAYFERFYEDLANQRFQLIVSHPLNTILKGAGESFGEENDAWVKWVSAPLLMHYEPVFKADKVSIWLLAPSVEPLSGGSD